MEHLPIFTPVECYAYCLRQQGPGTNPSWAMSLLFLMQSTSVMLPASARPVTYKTQFFHFPVLLPASPELCHFSEWHVLESSNP